MALYYAMIRHACLGAKWGSAWSRWQLCLADDQNRTPCHIQVTAYFISYSWAARYSHFVHPYPAEPKNRRSSGPKGPPEFHRLGPPLEQANEALAAVKSDAIDGTAVIVP
jgi:hypothetical protein